MPVMWWVAGLVVLGGVIPLGAQGAVPENLARAATATATGDAGGVYGPGAAIDGNDRTHWASADATLPQELILTWPAPVRFDTVRIDPYAREDTNLYAMPQTVELEAGGQTVTVKTADYPVDSWLVRFPEPVESAQLVVRITVVQTPRHYVGIDEVEVFHDPERAVTEPPPLAHALPRDEVAVLGGRSHPCVFYTPADVERARRNQQTAWGQRIRDRVVATADRWLEQDEAWWRQFLPEPGACYAYGFVACPICNSSWGTWGGVKASWDDPGHVTCWKGHRLPDAEHPDDGTGWRGPDGRIHYMVGSWNAWVTEQWTMNAIGNLAHAWVLTGDDRYAERAAFFLDLVASIYPESTAGSWDYPSSPPSGRFARPWYQVARVLTPLVEAYDLLYDHPAFQQPSLRPALEATWPDGPTAQQRAVQTADARGVSHPGQTRRENIDLNLVQDGAYYCYARCFDGLLTNGHADYMRGSLAAGALLNIPEYIDIAVTGPYSIRAQVINNADRDGHYYETSVMYAVHARSLYLTFVDPLRHWRSEKYPEGVDLMADPQFRSFYLVPDLSLYTAGRVPNFGDTAPDDGFLQAPLRSTSGADYKFAEAVFARSTGAVRDEYAGILRWLADGDVEQLRRSRASLDQLYLAEPVPDGPATLPAEAERRISGSWFLGQRGLALLRDGAEQTAQAALLRFGPSLNHGHLDDLGLLYYAQGWQMTYDVGYGLGSTHTQVGWARQTASHSLVTVNEASQRGGDEGGSGGSLYLFARLPGLKLVEADAPLAYRTQGVHQYRRTVALVGEGRDQVVIDLFRVRGGSQHDYTIGGHSRDVTVDGVGLGAPAAGSLAGPEIDWAAKQLPDGDLAGFPNKPYWNPPPGNGLGFLTGPRRGAPTGPWTTTWALGEAGDAKFAVTFLPEGGEEAILADGPGLYPRHAKGTWALQRRRGDDLTSTFASVMAPVAGPARAGLSQPDQLMSRVIESDVTPILGSGFGPGYLFFPGTAAGQGLTLSLPVATTDTYRLAVDFLHYPSYGTVQVSLDGQPLGEPVVLQAAEARAQQRVELGAHRLEAGTHQLRIATVADSPARMFGVQGVRLLPEREAAARDVAGSPVSAAERLAVTVETAPGPASEGPWRAANTADEVTPAAVHLVRAGRDEYLLSGGPSGTWRVETAHGPLRWTGGVAWVVFEGDRLVELATAGAARVEAAGTVLTTPGILTGQVTAVDDDGRAVEVTGTLPATGLEGEAVIFSRPEYSRTTAYRLGEVIARPGGARIELGDQTTRLGQGRVFNVTSPTEFVSDVPHEYNRSVIGGTRTRFFDGKRLVSASGTETRIRQMTFGQPMPVTVDSTAGLTPGELVTWYDLSVGDTWAVPTTALARWADGWTVHATAPVTLTPAGGPATNYPATGLAGG